MNLRAPVHVAGRVRLGGKTADMLAMRPGEARGQQHVQRLTHKLRGRVTENPFRALVEDEMRWSSSTLMMASAARLTMFVNRAWAPFGDGRVCIWSNAIFECLLLLGQAQRCMVQRLAQAFKFDIAACGTIVVRPAPISSDPANAVACANTLAERHKNSISNTIAIAIANTAATSVFLRI